MHRLFLLGIIVLAVAISACSKEKKINEGITHYNEGLYQSAFVKIKEGLIEYSLHDEVDSRNLIFTSHAVFSSETLLSMIYPKKKTYNFSRQVAGVWYAPDEDVCVVTDGVIVSVFNDQKQYEISNPSKEPIKAVAHAQRTFILSGKTLYAHSPQDNQVTKISTIEFSPPEALKYYNGYVNISNDRIVVITGIAGLYNLWVLKTNGEPVIRSMRIASFKHYMHNDTLFVIRGSAGNWNIRSINLLSKEEDTIRTFDKLHDIHMTSAGIVINTGSAMHIYRYQETFHVLPFVYSIRGETNTLLLIDMDSQLLIDSHEYFDKIDEIVKKTGCCKDEVKI